MTETTAERLRQAADLLEQRAKAATPGPWARHRPGAPVVSAPLPDGEPGRYRDGVDANGHPERVAVVSVRTWEGTGQFVRERSGRDLDWIALMSPDLADTLAAWLRAEADDADLLDAGNLPDGSLDKAAAVRALAVADVILGARSE